MNHFRHTAQLGRGDNDPDSIVEVLTLAHKYVMQDNQLFFFMYDRLVANPEVFPDDNASGYSASIAPDQQPEETPVLSGEGEPLEDLKEAQQVAVHLVCQRRGGKAKCLKRIVDHVRAQSLLAAHSAEIKLEAESERIPIGQTQPAEANQE